MKDPLFNYLVATDQLDDFLGYEQKQVEDIIDDEEEQINEDEETLDEDDEEETT